MRSGRSRQTENRGCRMRAAHNLKNERGTPYELTNNVRVPIVTELTNLLMFFDAWLAILLTLR